MSAPRNEPDVVHGHDVYTDAELLELSQSNSQAFLMAGVLAIGGDEEVLETWIQAIAEVMTRGWDTDREWAPAEVLDALLTNYRTYGGWIVEVDFGDQASAAIIADIPDIELAETIGATDREADVLFRIGAHIATNLGRKMHWQRDSESGDVSIIVT